MSAAIQLVISFAYVAISQAQSNDITKLFKIGSSFNGIEPKSYENYRGYHYAHSDYSLPDSALTVCFGVVIAYMTYIIIMLMIEPKLPAGFDNTNNPGLQALLAHHHFHQNGVPAKMRNMYDTDTFLQEQTFIGKDKDVTPVHLTPVKKKGNVLDL